MCVMDYPSQIYYVVHRLTTITGMVIHLGVHQHPMANGTCREFVDETIRLIAKEVNHTPNVKIYVISLGVSKTLATHLLDDSGNGIVELLNGEQLE